MCNVRVPDADTAPVNATMAPHLLSSEKETFPSPSPYLPVQLLAELPRPANHASMVALGPTPRLALRAEGKSKEDVFFFLLG